MIRARAGRGLAAALLALAACAPAPTAKIHLDLAAFDDDGLTGPPDGRRAGAYELCLPATPEAQATATAIDPTLRLSPGAPGRIGCPAGQVLAIGSTHQPGFRDVLERLAALPDVARIDPFVGE